MKKTAFVLIFVLSAFSSSYAQKGKVTAAMNYLTNKEIEKSWEAIQVAEKNEKTVGYAKTYFVKGKILQAMAESKDEKIKKLVEDPLPKAYAAYKKAIAMDEKQKINKSVEIQLPMLNNDFINLGIVKFQAKEFPGALDAFETSLEIGKNSIFGGAVDTTIVFNAGLAAYNGKMWDKANLYFGQAKDLSYGGTNVYQLMNTVYLNQGDTAKAESIMKEGIAAYPDDHSILLGLLQYFLNTGKDQEAMKYLAAAKEKEPDNKVLWYVEGLLYDRSNAPEKALAAYKKAIEIDSLYFDPYYNSGILLYNKAVALNNDANQIMDNAKYNEAKKNADEVFGSSIPYFEKVVEILGSQELDPGGDPYLTYTNSLENLKILYYRLKMLEKRDVVIQKLEELNK